MRYVYLLKAETEEQTIYKIGFTKNLPSKRIKQLQTGCPLEIKLADYFMSEYATVIESALHNKYKLNKVNGEWYDIPDHEASEFKSLCQKIHNANEAINYGY